MQARAAFRWWVNQRFISYPDRGQNAFSPRLSTAYNLTDNVVLYAAG